MLSHPNFWGIFLTPKSFWIKYEFEIFKLLLSVFFTFYTFPSFLKLGLEMFEKSQNLYREKPFQGQKNNSVDYCAADLFIGMTTEGPGFCFCLVVFHVSDGVGVNLLPILHSERSIIVIQEVCSSLLGWGHYKAPPCISSQEASISFNWIDKWKDEWDSTSPLHCWVVLSFCAQVCLFRFLALILRKQTEVFLHFCLLSCWVRSKSPCWRNLWYLCLRHVDVTLVVSYTFSNVNRTLLFS